MKQKINVENLQNYCEKLNVALSRYQSNIDCIKSNIACEYERYFSGNSYEYCSVYDVIRKYTIEKELRHYRKVLNQEIQNLIDDYQ